MKNKFDIQTLSRVYKAQTPSPYIILNDFLDESTAHKLADECDLITEKDYDVNSDGEYDNHEHSNLKRGVKTISKLPPNMQYMCRYFNGDKFMEWLRKLTGNSKLVSEIIASTVLVIEVPAVSPKTISSPTFNSVVNLVPEPITIEPEAILKLPVSVKFSPYVDDNAVSAVYVGVPG